MVLIIGGAFTLGALRGHESTFSNNAIDMLVRVVW